MGTRTTLAALETEFYRAKQYMEAAIAQVSDISLHEQIGPRQNSIAVIMQHLHGSMLSRFTDFLHSDGEKRSRNRDAEFVDQDLSRDRLMMLWDQAWSCVFDSTATLTDRDLSRVVTVRGEPHTVALALARQVAHYSWHAGQIALIAKHFVGERWKYLTIPPGRSEESNARMFARNNELT